MNAGAQGEPDSPLDRFRALVLADPGLQLELSQPYDPAVFAGLAVTRAAERGVALSPEDIRGQTRPDPLGLYRFRPQATLDDDWPAGDWLPVHIETMGEPYVDWAHLAGQPLTAPFFEESRRRAMSLPFNAMFRRRTVLDVFIAKATADRVRTPRGLIFHMSRCGSTLVAQMLAAVADNTVVSEAPSLDTAVMLEAAAPTSPAGVLAATVSALGRRRPADDGRLFLKHDSWHVMNLPLLRRVFPRTPWVFLYRDPTEVLVSQARVPGMQIVPGMLPGDVFGLDPAGLPHDAYGAAALGRTCEAAARCIGLGGGLLVNYSELPDAVWTRILPHFGVACGAADRAAMARAAGQDAKAPSAAFTPDSEAKRREATPRILELVESYMAEPHRRLEALRTASAGRA